MRRNSWLGVWLPAWAGAALVALGCSDREPVAPIHSPPTPPSFQARGDRVDATRGVRLVVTLAGAERSDFAASVRALGGHVERRHPEIATVTVRGVSARDARVLASGPGVASVDSDLVLQWIPRPDQLFREFAGGDAPAVTPQGTDQSGAELIRFQWNMRVIGAAAAWHATPAGNGRLVCVLDTGIDPDHIEVAGKIALDRSTSFVDDEPTIQDFNTHGTFVSSIVASNGIRLASVASDARLCAVKVLGTNGKGTFADLIAGILYAAHQGADVINMSLGAYVDLRQPGVRPLVQALQKAINFAARRGAVVVAAAGNDTLNLDTDSRSMLVIPAQLDHVISVGATAPFNQHDFDKLASYSNFGGRTGIALVAPGGDLPTGGSIFDLVLGACSHTEVTLPFTCRTSYVLSAAGTSFASPHVAGAAAVVASQFGRRTPQSITECLLETADRVGPLEIFGAGRLNVANAAACQERRDPHPRLATR
jgi:subtilisin family serine protease